MAEAADVFRSATATAGLAPAVADCMSPVPGCGAAGGLWGSVGGVGNAAETYHLSGPPGRNGKSGMCTDPVSDLTAGSRVAPLWIGTATVPVAALGRAYRATVLAEDVSGPLRWKAAGLPVGLSLAAGVIRGTPTRPGHFAVTLTAAEATGIAATMILTLVVV